MIIHVCALKLDEAEIILKAIEKAIRQYTGHYGAHRRTSYPARANGGVRAVIEIEVDQIIWELIKRPLYREAVLDWACRRLDKAIGIHYMRIIGAYEIATAESM